MAKPNQCQIEGRHELAILTCKISDVLFQISCPRCGYSILLTQTDIENAIVDALNKQGRYTDIERIT